MYGYEANRADFGVSSSTYRHGNKMYARERQQEKQQPPRESPGMAVTIDRRIVIRSDYWEKRRVEILILKYWKSSLSLQTNCVQLISAVLKMASEISQFCKFADMRISHTFTSHSDKYQKCENSNLVVRNIASNSQYSMNWEHAQFPDHPIQMNVQTMFVSMNGTCQEAIFSKNLTMRTESCMRELLFSNHSVVILVALHSSDEY